MNSNDKITDFCLWNLKSIDSPPFITLEYDKKEYEKLFKNTTFNILFNNQLESLENLLQKSKNSFQNELELLVKLIYKNWNSLRKEKSVQYMKKLKNLLNSFVEIKLDCLIEAIRLLNKSITNSNQSIVCIPTREVYEYFLIRLYGSFKIFECSIDLIRNKIHFYLLKQIKNAVYLSNNILFLSNVARIYCLIKRYKQSISFLYNSLREYINLFKSTNTKWSDKFNLDHLPICLKDEKKDDKNEFEYESFKLEVLEEELNSKEIKIDNDLYNLDIGERIERDFLEEKPVDKKTKSNKNEKLKKIFLKKLSFFIESYQSNSKLLSKNLRKYLRKNFKKNEKKFKIFLNDFVLDLKSDFKNDLDSIFKKFKLKKAKKKNLIRKLILKNVKKLIK